MNLEKEFIDRCISTGMCVDNPFGLHMETRIIIENILDDYSDSVARKKISKVLKPYINRISNSDDMTIQKLLDSIDESKMDVGGYVGDIFDIEFDIQFHGTQDRLTYCYYRTWICTDTQVGIRVWYLDKTPVCISSKPFRKATENFQWISEKSYNQVLLYGQSLISDFNDINIATDSSVKNILSQFDVIEYKEHEKLNIK